MIRILLVEDEKPIANLIRLSLTKEGYACSCAFDGLTAVDMLETNLYDLVPLDVMLPHVDGFELIEYIRPLEIPVIFITARDSFRIKSKDCAWAPRIISLSPLKSSSCWPELTWCCAAIRNAI